MPGIFVVGKSGLFRHYFKVCNKSCVETSLFTGQAKPGLMNPEMFFNLVNDKERAIMNGLKNFKKTLLLGTLVVGGAALTACENMQSQSSTAPTAMSMSTQAMTDMAMANMKKFMMLSDQDRMAYVMDKQQSSLKHGEELFASASLGTNGFSCSTCHPGGTTTGGKVPMGKMQMAIPSLVGAAATFPKFKPGNDAVITLAEMNNNCVVMFMKGQPISLGTKDARDLAAYITSLSKNQSLMPGKQNMKM